MVELEEMVELDLTEFGIDAAWRRRAPPSGIGQLAEVGPEFNCGALSSCLIKSPVFPRRFGPWLSQGSVGNY